MPRKTPTDLKKSRSIKLVRVGAGRLVRHDGRGQHDGHGVVHDALAEKQCIQIPVGVQLIKDGQHRHWVRGRDDGAKEKAVSVVKLPRQLTHRLHQLDHAVHQVPDNETGDGGAEEGVGDDGPQVPEEVSLLQTVARMENDGR